jgi:hypothetical protein
MGLNFTFRSGIKNSFLGFMKFCELLNWRVDPLDAEDQSDLTVSGMASWIGESFTIKNDPREEDAARDRVKSDEQKL